MTQDTFGGKQFRKRACMRRASVQDTQQGRHRTGMLAALGAVAVGALVLAGAVTGNLWPNAGDSGVESALAQPESAETAQAPDTDEAAAAREAAAPPVMEARAPSKPDFPQADAARVAADKSDSLSPDERIERAVARITAGSTDEKVKKAITVAAREKADQLDGNSGDTMITSALPESSAYAPARESLGRNGAGALGAIRNVDKSDEKAAARPELKTDKEKAAESKGSEPAVAAPTGPLAPATVSTAVNLRSGMTNGAGVVATVPANASIQASQSCRSWCEVVYNGQRGYIYKSFIRRAAETAAAAPAVPAEADATEKKAEAGDGILAQTGKANELAEAAARAQQGRR